MPPRYLSWSANRGREGFILVPGRTYLGALLAFVILRANLLLAAVGACHLGGGGVRGSPGRPAGECGPG